VRYPDRSMYLWYSFLRHHFSHHPSRKS
jgi:hypothetical protein